MPSFSQKSNNILNTCHPDLQKLMREVVKYEDCSIIEGRRDRETQERYFREGLTTLHYPSSKHNVEAPELSNAVDVVPYIKGIGQVWPNPKTDTPEDYKHKMYIFHSFCGYIKATANQLGIEIIQGQDWNGDRQYKENFIDLPHQELK